MFIAMVAYGQANKFIPRHLINGYHTLDNVNLSDSLKIERIADVVTPEYLVLNLVNPEATLEQLRPCLMKMILRMYIGIYDYYHTAYRFPLGFLLDIETPLIMDGKLYLNLQFPILFGELVLIGLAKGEVSFQFCSEDHLRMDHFSEMFSSFAIVEKLTFLDTDERRELHTGYFSHVIQNLAYIHFIPSKTELSDLYRMNLKYFHHPTKGFFFQCENVDLIKEIRLMLNGENNGFTYNRFLIKTKCIRFNNRIMYLPFHFDKSWSDRSTSAYEGCLNFSQFDKVNMIVKLDEPIAYLRIYALAFDMFRQQSQQGAPIWGGNGSFSTEVIEE